jgi:hypothetical protein
MPKDLTNLEELRQTARLFIHLPGWKAKLMRAKFQYHVWEVWNKPPLTYWVTFVGILSLVTYTVLLAITMSSFAHGMTIATLFGMAIGCNMKFRTWHLYKMSIYVKKRY